MTGRPAREERLELRLSSDELAAWRAEAERAGLSVSAWLRRSAQESIDLAAAVRRADEEAARRVRRLHGLDPQWARNALAGEVDDGWLDRLPEKHDDEGRTGS